MDTNENITSFEPELTQKFRLVGEKIQLTLYFFCSFLHFQWVLVTQKLLNGLLIWMMDSFKVKCIGCKYCLCGKKIYMRKNLIRVLVVQTMKFYTPTTQIPRPHISFCAQERILKHKTIKKDIVHYNLSGKKA